MFAIRVLCPLLVAVLFVCSVNASPVSRIKALYREGMSCMKAGHFDAALRCFSQVLEQDASYTAAYLRMGDVYQALQRPKDAEEQFRCALQQDPGNRQALTAIAHLYFDLQHYENALCFAEAAQQHGVSDMDRIIGLCHYQLKQYGPALNELLAAGRERAEDYEVWNAVGMVYCQEKNYIAAVKAFARGAQRNASSDAVVHLQYGTALLHVHDTTAGIKQLQACLDIRPEDSSALQLLAHTSYAKGQFIEAAGYWDKLLLSDPHNAFAMFMLGKAYISAGDRVKGEALCDKAFEIK
jgi:tetratricopeptide (TPR) repeat protein